jgi:hypothetical protein
MRMRICIRACIRICVCSLSAVRTRLVVVVVVSDDAFLIFFPFFPFILSIIFILVLVRLVHLVVMPKQVEFFLQNVAYAARGGRGRRGTPSRSRAPKPRRWP